MKKDKVWFKHQPRVGELARRRRGVYVSDHAIVRYMQRVHGIDLNQIRREIVNGANLNTMQAGDGIFDANGHLIVVQDGVVVTVLKSAGQRF